MRVHKSLRFLLLTGIFCLMIIAFKPAGKPTTPYPWPDLKFFPRMPHAEYNTVSVEGAALGRHLFYDPILSYDSTFSCGSCHFQAQAFTDSPNRFSTGLNGDQMKRNTMPLFNLAWYPSYHWDGEAKSLEEQVFLPVRATDEMNLSWDIATRRIKNSSFYKPLFEAAFGDQEIDSTLIAMAIAQFERTLISHSAKFDQVIRGERYFTTQEYDGFVIMNDQTKGDCLHCHTTDGNALGTTTKFSNNGLDKADIPADYEDAGLGGISGKQEDMGRFRIPTLRNIALTAPYMHDGRFATLEEVLDFYSDELKMSCNIDSKMGFAHRGGAHLSEKEKQSVIAFLHTLTDSVFITNPAFGNPFSARQ